MFFVVSYPKIPADLKLKTTTTTLEGPSWFFLGGSSQLVSKVIKLTPIYKQFNDIQRVLGTKTNHHYLPLLTIAWKMGPHLGYVVSKGGYFRHLPLDQPYFGDEN